MLIKFFPNGQGRGSGPVGYLIADQVLAYDANRDLIRDAGGQPMHTIRDPHPEVLRGNPDRVDGGREASRMGAIQPVGDLVEVAADAPDGQHQRRIDARGGLATAGIRAAKGLAQEGRYRHARRFSLLPKLGLLGRRAAEHESVRQRGLFAGSARARGVRRGGLPPLARPRVSSASV
jgi:hypothetical protein